MNDDTIFSFNLAQVRDLDYICELAHRYLRSYLATAQEAADKTWQERIVRYRKMFSTGIEQAKEKGYT